MSGELLFTVTPIWRTSSGSLGSALATRFWTSTWLWSTLVPCSNVTVMVSAPSPVEVEDM